MTSEAERQAHVATLQQQISELRVIASRRKTKTLRELLLQRSVAALSLARLQGPPVQAPALRQRVRSLW